MSDELPKNPTYLYNEENPKGKLFIVDTEEVEALLGDGWFDSPDGIDGPVDERSLLEKFKDGVDLTKIELRKIAADLELNIQASVNKAGFEKAIAAAVAPNTQNDGFTDEEAEEVDEAE